MPAAAAVSLAGQLRTFSHASAWRNLRSGLVEPLEADVFMLIAHDRANAGLSAAKLAWLPSSLVDLWAGLDAGALDAISGMQPKSIVMAGPPVPVCDSPMTVQWRNVHDGFRQVEGYERAHGFRYRWVVRARFDVHFLFRVPTLAALEDWARPRGDPIIAPKLRYGDGVYNLTGVDGAANPFGAEIQDWFALVPRRWASVYFSLDDSLAAACQPGGDAIRASHPLMCGGRAGSPECWLAAHLASNGVNGTELASINLASLPILTCHPGWHGAAQAVNLSSHCAAFLQKRRPKPSFVDRAWWAQPHEPPCQGNCGPSKAAARENHPHAAAWQGHAQPDQARACAATWEAAIRQRGERAKLAGIPLTGVEPITATPPRWLRAWNRSVPNFVVHVGRTCGTSVVALLENATVRHRQVHTFPADEGMLAGAQRVIVTTRDPVERAASEFESLLRLRKRCGGGDGKAWWCRSDVAAFYECWPTVSAFAEGIADSGACGNRARAMIGQMRMVRPPVRPSPCALRVTARAPRRGSASTSADCASSCDASRSSSPTP